MNIEAPAALWLTLAIPAIIALWLLRPRRVRQRVPSLLLWRTSDVQRHAARPWQRLRNHPLLWLQLLIALLLVAAALRPFLPAAAEAGHVVVLLDASGSMRATDVVPTRFAAARERVIDIARSLGPGQRLTVIRLDETPRVVASNAGTAEIERALAAQHAGYGTADVDAALALARGVAPGSGEWVLVTDGALDAPAGARLPDGVSLRRLLVGPADPAGNVAVTGLRVRVEDPAPGTDRPRPGDVDPLPPAEGGTEGGPTSGGASDAGVAGDRCCVSLQAGVRNTGSQRVTGRLVLVAETEVIGAQAWTLEPGAEHHLTWTGLPAGAHWFEARLADVPDTANALPQDDRAWAGVPSRDERRVLLVSDGSTFLERALAILGGVRADRVAADAWEAVVATAEPYDVVIFDGVWPDDPPAGNVLRVGPPPAPSFAPERVQPAAGHPLIRHVDWSDVRIAAAARLPDATAWDVVVGSPGGPLLVVRERGGRREAALTFSLAQSDLALRPAFPVLMANLLDWLAPQAAGEPIVAAPGAAVRVDAAPLAERIRVEDTAGNLEALAPPWPPAPFRPPVPGVYRVVQEAPARTYERTVIASGYLRSEATLARRDVSILDGAAQPAGPPPAAWSLWPLLAIAVIAASLVEWWVDARGR